eukprot:scaffold14418_cov135-Isochrysis_galbana.AAC.3
MHASLGALRAANRVEAALLLLGPVPSLVLLSPRRAAPALATVLAAAAWACAWGVAPIRAERAPEIAGGDRALARRSHRVVMRRGVAGIGLTAAAGAGWVAASPVRRLAVKLDVA